jgi:uncharacterized protein YdaU (DUF1376 family)
MAEFSGLTIWTDDYLADTRGLTQAEHGAYFLLLQTAWRSRDCALPDDDRVLARYAGCDLRVWKKQRANVLERFWSQLADGRWVQKRLLEERELVRKRADAARGNARKRWDANPLKPNGGGDAPASRPHVQPDMPPECSLDSDKDLKESPHTPRDRGAPELEDPEPHDPEADHDPEHDPDQPPADVIELDDGNAVFREIRDRWPRDRLGNTDRAMRWWRRKIDAGVPIDRLRRECEFYLGTRPAAPLALATFLRNLDPDLPERRAEPPAQGPTDDEQMIRDLVIGARTKGQPGQWVQRAADRIGMDAVRQIYRRTVAEGLDRATAWERVDRHARSLAEDERRKTA